MIQDIITRIAEIFSLENLQAVPSTTWYQTLKKIAASGWLILFVVWLIRGNRATDKE